MNYDDYFVVQARMVTELNLSGNRLLVYALIYGFCKDDVHEFRGSINYLCEWTNLSRNTIISTLKSLVEDKLLKKREYTENGVKFCTYSMGNNGRLPSLSLNLGGAKIAPPVQNQYKGSEKSSPNNIKENINKRKEDTNISSKKKYSLDLSIVAPEMQEVVETWLAYKKEKGKIYKPIGFKNFYKKLCEMSGCNPQIAMAIIEQSMANNYDGIFPLKVHNNNYAGTRTQSEKLRDTVIHANEYSKMLHDRVEQQATMGDGDSEEIRRLQDIF